MKHDIAAVCGNFKIDGEYVSGAPYGSGHINDTYAVNFNQDSGSVRYILQRINHDIFKKPALLMGNIERVVNHLRKKLEGKGVDDIDRRVLTLIPTQTDESFYVDVDGNYWRVYIFIENAKTFDELETTDQAYRAAKAFGQFQKDLVDLPGEPLIETIPGFHDTRSRFDAMKKALEEDVCGRAAGIQDVIDFALERESMVDVVLDMLEAGSIPLVTTHSDTKLNNVMLDDATGEGICVIDLDTVMPGSCLYDFGDMVRTAARPCPEDEMDLSKVVANVEMFEAIARGYLASAGDSLNQLEKDNLAFSAKLITFEIGLRFLTDYLEGDVYFKTHREGQNIDRCRVQFKMVENFESLMDEMNAIVANS